MSWHNAAQRSIYISKFFGCRSSLRQSMFKVWCVVCSILLQFVGDSVGVVNLTPAALQYLSEQVNKVLHSSIYRAKNFASHGRRTKVTGEDVELALNICRVKVCLVFFSGINLLFSLRWVCLCVVALLCNHSPCRIARSSLWTMIMMSKQATHQIRHSVKFQ